MAALFFLPVFPTFMLIDVLDDTERFPWLETSSTLLQLFKYFVLALPAGAVMIVLTALISAGIRWSVLPRLKSGSWPVHSNVYCGKWLVNQIQESSLQVLHGVYATLFAPMWYRLLGAKVGRNAEISTALGVVPDMLTLGDDTFIADAVLLGDEEIDGGWMTMRPTVISRRSFVGNGAYLPDGTTLPENVLIGVLGRAPEPAAIRSGDTWIGSPALRLPAREVVTGHPESLTFNPSPMRRLGRAMVEAFRIVAPHAMVIAAGYSIVLAVMPSAAAEHWGAVVWYLTIDGLIFGLSTFVFVALFKWLFLRRYRPHAVPMWTPFVWLSEAATNLYEGIAVPNFMHYLRGTPWLPIAFNLLGARIGRGVYLDTTDFTEFDCVRIGDYSELNAQSCPQTHLFEDRVMKIHHVNIGKRVSVGPRSIVLYGATVNDGAQLGPHDTGDERARAFRRPRAGVEIPRPPAERSAHRLAIGRLRCGVERNHSSRCQRGRPMPIRRTVLSRRWAARAAVAAGITLALAACMSSGPRSPEAPVLQPARIAEIVASPDRSEADRVNDVRRKPQEMLAFIGVRPGMVALDVSAAGGYTTELIARATGPTGRVYGQSPPRPPTSRPAQPEGAAAPAPMGSPAPAARRRRPATFAGRAGRTRKESEREQHRRRRASLRGSGAARMRVELPRPRHADVQLSRLRPHGRRPRGGESRGIRRAEAGRHVCHRRPFGAPGHRHLRIGNASPRRGSVPARARSSKPGSSWRPRATSCAIRRTRATATRRSRRNRRTSSCSSSSSPERIGLKRIPGMPRLAGYS